MKKDYFTEAFQALSALNEDVFTLTDDGVIEANEFINDEEAVIPEIEVHDEEAETEEEVKDSYLGKVILQCDVCGMNIYKDPEEVIIDEEAELANVADTCEQCQSNSGWKVIGQVAPFVKEEESIEVSAEDEQPVEETSIEESEEELEEAIKTKKGEKKLDSMKENLQNIEIETENEKIEVAVESKEEPVVEETPVEEAEENKEEEMVAPVEPETEEKFQDVEIDEFDEKEFDSLGEKYMKRVYENVESFKTTKGSIKGNSLKLEGVIKFKSGKEAKTNFVFEAKTITKTGKMKFLGENKQFAKGSKSFALTGSMNKNKLVVESLTYNYRAKDKDGSSKRLYGRVINR